MCQTTVHGTEEGVGDLQGVYIQEEGSGKLRYDFLDLYNFHERNRQDNVVENNLQGSGSGKTSLMK